MGRTEAQIRGRIGEDFCARVLRDQGYAVLDRNVNWQGRAEIDLIATRRQQLLFIEVKTRKQSADYGGIRYAIDPNQSRRLHMAARRYIQERRMNDYDVHLVAALIEISASSNPESCTFIPI